MDNSLSQDLSLPTNRAVSGPRFHNESDKLLIEYDDGHMEWTRITFKEVIALQYKDSSCCKETDIVDAKVLRCEKQSDWLSSILKLWQESVGWQKWQQKQGQADRFKHFTVYFDNAACIDVIAAEAYFA